MYEIQSLELRARVQLARGNTLEGLSQLSQAAEKQFDMQKHDNDPPKYPEFLFNALGRAYLDAKSPELAAKAFAKSLTLVRNDRFALDGMERAGRRSAPRVPRPERNYEKMSLDRFGPAVWEPFPAPSLVEEHKGRNVILVFYLGRECLHCMNQLKQISGKHDAWEQQEAVVVAVSPNPPGTKIDHVQVLSDPDRAAARRFGAYDEFEEMELHATVLIDRKGRVHWGSIGGEPFTDMNFIEKQLKRMNNQ